MMARLIPLERTCLVLLGVALVLAAETPRADGATRNQVVIAKRLAVTISTAKTTAARARAVRTVMRELGVRVHGASSSHTTAKPPNSSNDLYVYDFEVEALARALTRQRLTSLDELTNWTNALGGEHPLAPDRMLAVLSTDVSLAQRHPRQAKGLVALLVRALGLFHDHPYDLARHPDASRVEFDALQTVLFQADLAVAVLRQRVRPAARAADVWLEVPWWGRWTYKIARRVKASAAVVIQGLHGSLLAYSVAYRELENPLETHYSHGRLWHDVSRGLEGKPLSFRVQVLMLDDIPIEAVPGFPKLRIPPKGPIAGVEVTWPETSELAAHGIVVCGEACNVTNADGIATLMFYPRSEAVPGIGLARVDTGVIWARVWLQRSMGNFIGKVVDVVAPTAPMFRWFVGYHRPRGLTFRAQVAYGDDFLRVRAHHCGEVNATASDAGTWQLEMSITGSEDSARYDHVIGWAPLLAQPPGFLAAYGFPPVEWFDPFLLDTNPATVRAQALIQEWLDAAPHLLGTVDVPLEEDVGCPALPSTH